MILILVGESGSLNHVPVQEEAQDLFLSASPPAILQRAQGAPPPTAEGTHTTEGDAHMTRDNDRYRDKQEESQREADTERGAQA